MSRLVELSQLIIFINDNYRENDVFIVGDFNGEFDETKILLEKNPFEEIQKYLPEYKEF